ncbi:Prefoldin alpha-like [Trinorchestia longiramus]|nr:Prefoldin alpha-like [Trinorchestia longiramus]
MAGGETTKTSEKGDNLRGIPEAQFVEDVEEFMSKESGGAEEVIRRLDEQLSKYRFMESHLTATRTKLKHQVPDIKSCLQIIEEMKARQDSTEDLETRFLLSDQVYVKATIPPSNKVCLWLGANVMLEYDLDAAEVLLNKNLNNANTKLSQVISDLDFLRTQCTTTEVTIARVYNWDVRRRRAEAAKTTQQRKN